jgi:hypothetical protein
MVYETVQVNNDQTCRTIRAASHAFAKSHALEKKWTASTLVQA